MVARDDRSHRIADAMKDIRDESEAIRQYARQAQIRELEADSGEIRLRAERKLGELLRDAPKNPGTRPNTQHGGTMAAPPPTPTLTDQGINKKLSARAQKMAAVPEAEFEGKLASYRHNIVGPSAR